MHSLLALLFLACSFQLTAQQSDKILFTVEGQEVTVSEFEYIYNKNNRDGADYSKASLDEYLDLYVKFKLKVQRAKDMGLDTVKSLQTELDGYRKQLAAGYLNDNEVKASLVKEAYDRMQEDVQMAHILVAVPQNAPPEDTLKAYNKIMEAYTNLKSGTIFADVARLYSEDGNTKDNGGAVGYISAMLPSGFYAVETVAYETAKGGYSRPVRSSAGYHIIKVLDKRPARGKMDAAHLLVRVKKDGSNDDLAKQKIEQLYDQIQEGASFEELARKHSDDAKTAKRGGFIGTMGINIYDAPFEDAAFALENDGDVSVPVKTSLGWHLVKRVQKKPAENFESQKRRLESLVSQNERIDAATDAMISRIKKEGAYKLDASAYKSYVDQIDGDLFSYRWQAPTLKEQTLISFGDEMSFSTEDFGAFIRSQSRLRMRLPKTTAKEEVINQVFSAFVKEKALSYEESKLADKYPDFKALMREYEEGIMLFEATKINVWDRASSDTTGLKIFYEQNKNNYMWPERANVITYQMSAGDTKLMATFQKYAAKGMSKEKIISKLNKKKTTVTFKEKKVLPTDPLMDGLSWKVNSIAEPIPIKEKNLQTFRVVESIVPPANKQLNEARGYVIADYQDTLEKEWIKDLKETYEVTINNDVFESLIRK